MYGTVLGLYVSILNQPRFIRLQNLLKNDQEPRSTQTIKFTQQDPAFLYFLFTFLFKNKIKNRKN